MKSFLVAAVFLAALGGAAHAEEADDIREAIKAEAETFNARMYAGEPGNKAYACFVRRYDAEHLAHHPKQKVASMKLLISAEMDTEDKQFHNSFRLGFRYRHRSGDFDSSGSCHHAVFTKDGTEIRLGCGVDCEGRRHRRRALEGRQIGDRAAGAGQGLAEQQAGRRCRTVTGRRGRRRDFPPRSNGQ
ncbi:hypothetical protein ACVWXL_005592 [Bradyrhizobium sp. GM22.5]